MAKLLKLRRGSTSQHSSFTGAEGEVTVDTTKDTLVVHDGSTAGGIPLAKESAVTAIPAVIDEDNMSSNSATRPPSQQSVKAYVDAIPDVIDEDNFATNSATRPPSQQSVGAYLSTQLLLKANRSGTEFTGEVGLKGDDQLKFYDADDGEYVHIKSPTSLTGSTTYVLPVDDGSAGQLLKTDGSGNLSWATDSTLSLIDEDNMATNSATRPPSQQSVKAYTDTTFAPKAAPAFTGTATGVNLTLSGNLTVNGTTTTVATTNTTVTDNLLELNSGAGSNANDSGILIERGSTGDNAIIAWDESADRFTLGTTTATNDATGNISISTGTLAANIVGDVTGDVTGSSGSCTGNAATADAVDTTSSNNDATHYLTMVSSSGTEAGSTIRKYSNINCNPNSGTVTATILNDSKGDVRSIPKLTETSAHTPSTAHVGYVIYISSGGVTFNNNTFSAGHVMTVINNSGSDQTITQGSGLTIYNTADAATGNRTLAGRGMATIWFADASTAYISGAGLS